MANKMSVQHEPVESVIGSIVFRIYIDSFITELIVDETWVGVKYNKNNRHIKHFANKMDFNEILIFSYPSWRQSCEFVPSRRRIIYYNTYIYLAQKKLL